MSLPEPADIDRLLARLRDRLATSSDDAEAAAAHAERLASQTEDDDSDEHLWLDIPASWRPELDDHDVAFAVFEDDLPPLPTMLRSEALATARDALLTEVRAAEARLALGTEITVFVCPHCASDDIGYDAHVYPEPNLGLHQLVTVYDKGHSCNACGKDLKRAVKTLVRRSAHEVVAERETLRGFVAAAGAGLARIAALEAASQTAPPPPN